MSEFKFACPICRQHIRSDSSASGTQIECPTCFKKIVVPQAPADTETKFILAAKQAPGKRPITEIAPAIAPSAKRPRWVGWAAATLGIAVLAGAAVTVAKLGGFKMPWTPAGTNRSPLATSPHLPPPVSSVADARWQLELRDAVIPEVAASGRIKGQPFKLQRATIQNGTLALRQGGAWPPEVGVTILLPKHPAQDFAGKRFLIATNYEGQAPQVVLRIKNSEQKEVTERVMGGYALKLEFDKAADEVLPGRIYLCTPDAAKSVVVGSFRAEIRKPAPPKRPKQPKSLSPAPAPPPGV